MPGVVGAGVGAGVGGERLVSAFREFVERYGPTAGVGASVRLVREVFGVEPDDWQREGLDAFDRGERRISVRSCHGVGKTAWLSWLVWAMLLARFPQKTVATAPSRGQLEDALVVEVLKWYGRLPSALQELFELKKNRIELRAAPNESFFTARTAREENPEALQGIHSDHVLLIADEGSGVPEKIYEGGGGSMSGHSATTVLAGNPVRTSGLFFDTHHRLKSDWFTLHVIAAGAVRGSLAPGSYASTRVSDEFVHQIAHTYGEKSNAYRVRAAGEFPLGEADSIIPLEYAESAQNRDIVTHPDMREVWGLDVGRGGDANVLVRRNKFAVLPGILLWTNYDLMETAGRVKREYDDVPERLRPDEILVDAIGLGGGVADRLFELKLPVRSINVSETASMEDRYRDLRTELWFESREWLAKRDRALPKCDGKCPDRRECVHNMLIAELVAQKYAVAESNGKLYALPKSETKKILGRSPNIADAVMLTFASEPAALLHGARDAGRSGTRWDEPISRKLAVV